MFTKLYRFKSDDLKNRYVSGVIDYPTYSLALEALKTKELDSIVFDFKRREIEEEIAAFELQQVEAAHQEIERRKQAEVLRIQAETEKIKQQLALKQRQDEEKKMQMHSLEEKILAARKKFYEDETPALIEEYKTKARQHRRKHDLLQFIIIAFSALATSTTAATIFTGDTTTSTVLKIIAAFFSLVVTIASGSIAYFKYKERSNDTQKAIDTIEDDHTALKLGIGAYTNKKLEEALSLFAQNTHNTISEHKKKQQLLDQPPDTKPSQST